MHRKFVLILIFGLDCLSHSNAQMKPGWVFHDELIQGLESAKDTIYIEDRKKLEKFIGLPTSHDSTTINYKTKSGDSIHILLVSKKFNPSKHNSEQLKQKNFIDNKYAYGVDETIPRKEIEYLEIKWNKIRLTIPGKAYRNLFNPGMDIEAYLAKSRKLLYVYMQGGDGAGSYSVKFVFNKTGYLARLISANECVDGFDFLDATSGDCE